MKAYRIMFGLWLLGNLLFVSVSMAEESPQQVVEFGDSTTAPRGSLRVYSLILQEHFRKTGQPVRVTNAGVPGNHTVAARKRFQKDVLDRRPAVVIIQFGINDSAIDVWKTPPAKSPRVSQEAYEQNLQFFIHELQQRNVSIILMTPNPLAWTPKLKELYGKPPYNPQDEDGFNLLLKEFAASCRKIAKQEKIPMVDVYAEFQKQDVSQLLLDGMHPNENGHQLVAEQILKLLPEILGKRSTEQE
ncbi:MAG: hypothetical protein HON04_18005 [Planctomicrobium sp.]|jgi:lysophospholipase L1-like esterase|nr:hypothetical protein [Planctomicrobium sp.]